MKHCERGLHIYCVTFACHQLAVLVRDNGDFTSADLVLALQDGGYETGPRAAATAVPEPTAAWLVLIGLLAVARRCGL